MRKTNDFKTIFLTTIIMSLLFSTILGLTPFSNAQNVAMRQPTGMVPIINITMLTFSNDDPLEDEEIIISATILNTGSVYLNNITLSFTIDYKVINNVTDLTINVNESKTIDILWHAEKWNHNISVMAYLDGTPLKESMIGKEIYVEAKPIGDISTLILGLIIIFFVVIGIMLIPSLWVALKKTPKKVK